MVYDPSLVARSDAGRDAPSGACTPRAAPPRPTTADLPDGPEVAFAMRDSFLDQGAEWEEIGLDLDGFCTVGSSSPSECMSRETDGTDGIDNVFGDELYPLVEAVTPGLEDVARAAQEDGLGQPVLVLRGWNGTANDPLVDASIASAVFSTSADGDTADAPPAVTIRSPTDYELAGGGAVPLPVWDGLDWTWLREDAFFEGDILRANVRDEAAYVADGRIVVRLPNRIDIVLPTEEAGVLVRLGGATAIGTLSSDLRRIETLVVAGRWSVIDLLATAENVGICRGSPQYEVLATRLGQIADLRATQPSEPDPAIPCNAISLGVTFTGTRVRVAGLTAGLGLSSGCADTDAGVADAGVADAGAIDAGPSDADSTLDAGTPDAGSVDAPGIDARR
jgi:hypothetical protein